MKVYLRGFGSNPQPGGAMEKPKADVGKLGVCSLGRIGIIEGRKELPWGLAWVGTGFFDDKPWSSREPQVLSDDEAESIRRTRVRERRDR